MRYRILGVGGGFILLAGTLGLLVSGRSGADTAGVLTFALTALLVILTVFASPWLLKSKDQRLADAAEGFARAAFDRESREQAKFLARAGGQPADVSFRQSALGYWQSDDGEQHGSLINIADFYSRLNGGRLVIIGVPGSGKTVLANQLLLDRITALLSAGSSIRAGSGIPVRLSIAAFDPADGTDDGDVAARLDDWITSRLAEDFRLPRRIAAELVAKGWILPVLDGLDEMDQRVPDDRGDEPEGRADSLIRALNVAIGGRFRPVVVTCRTDRYRQLSAPTTPGQERVLMNASTVELQPLTSAQIAAYLKDRFPDPADHDQVEKRWRPVVR